MKSRLRAGSGDIFTDLNGIAAAASMRAHGRAQTPYNITVKHPLPVHHRLRRPLNHEGTERPGHNRVTALPPYYLYPFRRQNCFDHRDSLTIRPSTRLTVPFYRQ